MGRLQDAHSIKGFMRTEVLLIASKHIEWADQLVELSSDETVVKSPNASRDGTCFRGSWLQSCLATKASVLNHAL